MDDSLVTREMERRLLEDAGFDVTAASDADEGLNYLGEGEFDCLVTDIEMPGIDGYELTRRLRSIPQFAHLPIIVVSTRDRPEDRLQGLQAGADAYLTKQALDAGELVDLVRTPERFPVSQPDEPLRVLLVDDSPSVRAVLKRFFSWTDDLVVVGEAEDGASAVEQVPRPRARRGADGPGDARHGRLRRHRADHGAAADADHRPLLARQPQPDADRLRGHAAGRGRGAGQAGGHRPAGAQLADTLPEMVRTVAAARTRPEAGEPAAGLYPPRRPRRKAREPRAMETVPRPLRWVGIGASTGGPAALRDLLDAMPEAFPQTLLVVQHITGGFEAGLADWLNREFPFDVRLAVDGEVPGPGKVRLAPAGAHLRLERGGALHLDTTRGPRGGHLPAVDELFSSMAQSHPESSAGVILTGMGADGVEGLAELKAAGGLTIAQDGPSCVVYGMPRVAVERGAADLELLPGEIGPYLCGLPGSSGRSGRSGGSGRGRGGA